MKKTNGSNVFFTFNLCHYTEVEDWRVEVEAMREQWTAGDGDEDGTDSLGGGGHGGGVAAVHGVGGVLGGGAGHSSGFGSSGVGGGGGAGDLSEDTLEFGNQPQAFRVRGLLELPPLRMMNTMPRPAPFGGPPQSPPSSRD